jgi:SAM-dependent methyltransferase
VAAETVGQTKSQVERATFVSREQCIGCESKALKRLSGGSFAADPLRSFIEADPWGVSPIPYIAHAQWEYVACADCGQTFHRYVLSPEWQTRRYSEWMGEKAIREFEQRQGIVAFGASFREGQDRAAHVLKIERLTRSIRDRGPVRVLDFGCGWGQFLTQASILGFEAYGIDKDAHRLKGSAGDVKFYPDLEALDSAVRQRFHAITLFEVLEHLVEPMKVLLALRQRLVPGGILVLEVPDCEGVSDIRSEFEYRKIHPLDHVNGFTRPSLRSFAQRAGFEQVIPPAAYVTTEPLRIVKTSIKQLAERFLAKTARLYFRLRGA